MIQLTTVEQLISQENETTSTRKTFDKSEWKKTTKELDYTETYKEWKKKEKDENKEKGEPKKNGLKERKTRTPLLGGGFVKTLLIVLIAGILSFFIFLLLKNTFNIFSERVPDTKLESIVENLEDNLHNADFDNLIQQAIGNKQYKLAVRIFYLHIIKILSDKELIKWKKNKTNGHYVREMFQNTSGQKFSFLTAIYEQAWFGTNSIDEDNYKLISREFSDFLKELD